ncbi:hypothetical protein CC80DRAFT_510642 [Byssothecium circinans]|uniref:SH3 domain-containing protein n=1 Tax=Byssothecium circinans TaxID=147558 RepID=A0A6A5TC91_9PLEO|nr:hypothetical protein CC80DRAFT_510642 [Byssothecium circinans]
MVDERMARAASCTRHSLRSPATLNLLGIDRLYLPQPAPSTPSNTVIRRFAIAMVHLHGLSHLARRQRNRHQNDDDEEEEVTVIVTMSNTFTGDVVWVTQTPKQTAGAPVQQTRVSSNSKPTTAAATSRKASTSAKETRSEETAKPTSSHDSSFSLAAAASSSSSSDISTQAAVATAASSLAASVASTSTSPSASPSAEAASSGGMSGGAKAGLTLGILLVLAAILGAVLFVYKRKKQNAAQQKVDDEKAAMRSAPPPPPPQVEAAPSVHTPRSVTAAPRLSLRPVTQFDPAFPNRKSNGNVLAIAATGPSRERSPSPDRAKSPWERPGATNAAAPANPFNDPQPRSSGSQDPFSNNAAIAAQTSAPSTPTTVDQPATPGAEFANPALAIAAADATVLQTPSTVKSAIDSIPSSPAWTEDIPASPGPAPSGPLPVATTGRPSNGPNSVQNNVHRIQLDFKPSMADELELRAGQLVRMLHEYDDGWALCVHLALACVEPLSAIQESPTRVLSHQPLGPILRIRPPSLRATVAYLQAPVP